MTRHDGERDHLPAALRAALGALEAPPAPDGLIERVVAERAGGARLAIPEGDARSRAIVRPTVLAAAAALLVVGLVGIERWPWVGHPGQRVVSQEECDMKPDVDGWLMASSLLLATACAQEADRSLLEPTAPAVELESDRPHPGTWVYELRWPGGKGGAREVYELSQVDSPDGVRWMSVHTRGTAPITPIHRALVDTMYYSAEMRPLHQVWRTLHDGKDWRIVEIEYGPTTVDIRSDYVDYRGPAPRRETWWRRSVSAPAGGPIMPAIHAPALVYLVQRLPLSPGWSGTVPAGPYGTATFHPLSLRVVGEETVLVPAGEFDCWKVSAGYRTLWVSKEGRLLVRTLIGPEGRGLEWMLTSFAPAPG